MQAYGCLSLDLLQLSTELLLSGHQIAAGGIRPTGAHPSLAEAREQLDECCNAGAVGIVDDEFANPSLEQGDLDRAACAASADE